MLLMLICGMYSLYPARGIMPRVPAPVTKPSEERVGKAPAGLSLCNAVRKKLRRDSFTAVDPNVFVLLITNVCAREDVEAGKPGTFAKPANALLTVVLSMW